MLCSCVSSSSKAARTPWGSPFTLLFLKGWSGSTCPVSLDTHAHTHSSVKPCGWFSWKRKCWLKFLLLCLPSTEQMQPWSQTWSLSWAWCCGQDSVHTWGLLSWRLQSRRATATAQLLVQVSIQSTESTVHKKLESQGGRGRGRGWPSHWAS